MTILIVEDAPVDAIVLRNIVSRAGHIPIVVGNGQDALGTLEERPEVVLVLADVHMPGMTGVELLGAMRDRPALAEVPVVFVSGAADAQTVQEAVSLRPVGYVLKPLNEPSRILDLVGQALEGITPFVRGEVGDPCHHSERTELAAALRSLLGPDAPEGSTPPSLEAVVDLAKESGAPRLVAAVGSGGGGVDHPLVQRTLRGTLNVLDARGY